ncbi:MAG: efflux RND transporter periplasmic adaptor subunit [Tannerellaceae bacterium]|nr:efflux RND transporter periplasmic adaptor subunit [Tannerellaceae bacterium]
MIQKQFSILIPAFILCLLATCSNNKEHTTTGEENKVNRQFLKNIKTTEVIKADQETEMTLTGKVISDPDKTIAYTPLVSGIIERTYFSLGDKVSKGQKLMDIRSTELSGLQAELISTESELAIARRELQAAQSMHKDGMLSERELLEAQAQVNQAEAMLAKLTADISVFGANQGNGIFSVTSPASGYIITKEITSGSTVSAEGDPAFTVADLSSVWIIANVYASNLAFVREGMDAVITTLSYPGEKFPGRITALSQVFDPEDKALKARIVLPNPGLKLKPEMSVVIKLKETDTNQQVAVPSDVLIFDNDTYYAIVEETTGNFSIREVVPIGHNNNTTFLAGGLKEGEKVVSKNQLLIYSELKGK